MKQKILCSLRSWLNHLPRVIFLRTLSNDWWAGEEKCWILKLFNIMKQNSIKQMLLFLGFSIKWEIFSYSRRKLTSIKGIESLLRIRVYVNPHGVIVRALRIWLAERCSFTWCSFIMKKFWGRNLCWLFLQMLTQNNHRG